MEPTCIKSISELFAGAYVLHEGYLAKVLGVTPDPEGGYFVQIDVYVHSVDAPTEYVVTVDRLRDLPLDNVDISCLHMLTPGEMQNLKEGYLGFSLHFAQYSYLVFGTGKLEVDLVRLNDYLRIK
jgi:hypothetical protein